MSLSFKISFTPVCPHLPPWAALPTISVDHPFTTSKFLQVIEPPLYNIANPDDLGVVL